MTFRGSALVGGLRHFVPQRIVRATISRVAQRLCGYVLITLLIGCNSNSPQISGKQQEESRSLLIDSQENDLGDIDLLDNAPTIISRQVVLTNASSASVQITRIKRECNCMTTRSDLPRVLEAGKSLAIEFEFTLQNSASTGFSNRATIHTDEGGGKEYPVVFSGRVRSKTSIAAVPAVVDFGIFGDWESPEEVIKILSQSAEPIGDVKVTGDDGGIVCSAMDEEPNRPARFRVSTRDDLDRGAFVRRVSFQTNHGEAKIIVKGTKTDGVIVSPPVVVFRRDGVLKSLLLKHNPQESLTAIRVSCKIKTIELEHVERLEAGLIRIDVHLVDAKEGDFAKGVLQVISECEKRESTSEIPVFINLRAEGD